MRSFLVSGGRELRSLPKTIRGPRRFRVLRLPAMAAYGVFMKFLSLTVAGVLTATVLGAIFAFFGFSYLPANTTGRRKFTWKCVGAPFLGLLWAMFVFAVYSYAIGFLFHRDDRMSTNPHTPLPDKYVIGNMDYENGYVIKPGMTMNGFPEDTADCVAGVVDFEIADPYLLGSKSNWPSPHKQYFILDTRTGQLLRFESIGDEQKAASARGIALNFSESGGYSLWDAYTKYRPIWFDGFFPVLSLVGIACLFSSLMVQGRQLKQSAHEAETRRHETLPH
jgi:hypothetical protein